MSADNSVATLPNLSYIPYQYSCTQKNHLKLHVLCEISDHDLVVCSHSEYYWEYCCFQQRSGYTIRIRYLSS